MQPPQKSLHLSKAPPTYILQLRKALEEKLLECNNHDRQQSWESLEIQIKRWWVNLPPIMQQRRFQIVEIATQCRGRYQDKPALREVAAALRALGWIEVRDWSNKGRNRRFWKPRSTHCDFKQPTY